jgi:hypothetical protein
MSKVQDMSLCLVAMGIRPLMFDVVALRLCSEGFGCLLCASTPIPW